MFGFKKAATNVAVKGGVAVAEAAGDLAKKAEITLRISQARSEARAIAELSKKLAGAPGRMVAEIAIVADQIISEVEKDPRDFQVIRSFFDYNLGKAKEVIEARVSMSKLPDQEANVQKIDEVIGEIFASFRDFYTKCHANDVFSAQVASESLSRIMRAGV
jgi:hypothetical protein